MRSLIHTVSKRLLPASKAYARRSLSTAERTLKAMDVQNPEYLTLKWDDGSKDRFHLLHLRTWCPCPKCQHETGQRLINSNDIDRKKLDVEDIFIKGRSLHVVWKPDMHESVFDWSWLQENSYSDEKLEQEAKDMTTTSLHKQDEIPQVSYEHVMDTTNKDEGLFQLLHRIVEHGFAVVKNTPLEENEVKRIAERIAPLSHSFQYGDVFNVIAEPDPVNIAYTSNHLRHHLDLAYYESPPGLQFLHALRFDKNVRGGDSTFVDVFAVANELRRTYPQYFKTLCRVPATFQKYNVERSNPTIMQYQRPHIQLNHRDEVIAVHWSPPFEGPLKVPFEDVMPYYEAYKAMHDLVEGGKFLVQFRLEEGDTVIFNQRRVLHGRKEFSLASSGVRHLQGTYVNIDDALCRYNVLRYQLHQDDPTYKNRRVGNGNFS